MKSLNFERNFLDNAEQQAEQKGLYDIPIVDADAHHMVTPWEEITPFLEEPWKRRIEKAPKVSLIPRDLGDRTVAGRIKGSKHFNNFPVPEGQDLHAQIYPLLDSSCKMGIDYSVVFPTDLLGMGLHPEVDLEVAVAKGYARWMTEKVLPADESLITMLNLPFSDPKACVEMVEEFGEKKGVVGFMVTSVRNQPVHHNDYMPLYARLQERNLPLGFHSLSYWLDRPFQQFNRFMSVHALGFPLYNMVNLTNLIVNGIPERFPGLKFIFIESGVAWIPFMMHRLDMEYMIRTSDAPLLKKKPSEYIKQFYFTTQPLEMPDDINDLAAIFKTIDAENTLLYASDYPHPDFDLPTTIYDLPFLSERAKRKILGENALRLFNIQNPKLLAKRESNA